MNNKRIILVGANGQVGGELVRALDPISTVIAIDRSQLDLEDSQSIIPFLKNNHPDLIINAAAYTAVDNAEVEQDKARIINADAPAMMAEYAASVSVPLIHYSTDYVFDGESTKPYLETEMPSPKSVYGESKFQGEQAVLNSRADYLVFRTSWVYGLRGHNFLLTMLRLFNERDELSIVDDQIGAPTAAYAIADATKQIVEKLWNNENDFSFSKCKGLYHMSASGQTSWFGFAQAILEHAKSTGVSCHLQPISTGEYPTPAIRPAYSVLDNYKLNSTLGIQLANWEEQLAEVMRQWLDKPE